MYVDKPLSGVLAVQTLSRLNRAHPQKHDTFVLDFADNAEAVKAAFQDYYRVTIQDGETDPNKLHDLKAELDNLQVYSGQQVEELVTLYIGGAERSKLDPILDACVAAYLETLTLFAAETVLSAEMGREEAGRIRGLVKAVDELYEQSAAFGQDAFWERLNGALTRYTERFGELP